MPAIKIHQSVLSNGLRVVVCPDHGAPVVNVTVMYRVGSHDEVRGKTGLAHLFEHLMFDNTSNALVKQYDTYCAKAGGTNNAYTTFDYTTYYINLPAHQVELGYWLESERMRAFMITDHALSTQRSVVVEEIKQNVENQPYGKWRHAMEEQAFDPQSAYSWEVYGSADDVEGVTMADAKGFFDRFYQPANAVLCVAGDVTPEHATELAERHFGGINAPTSITERNVFDAAWRRMGTHGIVPDAVPMPAVFLAFHVPGLLDDASYAAEIAATILGSGRSSPLYRSLVQEQQIASSVGAFVDKRLHDSLLTFYAYASREDVTADQLVSAITSSIASTTCTEADRTKAVNKLRTSLAAELQRVSGVADSVAYHTLFYDEPDTVNEVLDKYSTQSLTLVQEIASGCADASLGVRVDIVPAVA
ncbi:MAG: pitrilysin family protein [bacterium]|nr:pitrilysin family protein [bacterium]